ncbi:MAG TPA: hypothetical protein VF895_00080 [Gaiellaceae bacterium]
MTVRALVPILLLLAAVATAATFPGRNGAIIASGPPRDVTELETLVYLPADGGDPRVLGLGQLPAWSPQGKRLAYDDGKGLVVASTDGYRLTSRRRLLRSPHGVHFWEAAWARHGRRLAYVSLDVHTDTSDIHTVRVSDGRRVQRLTYAKKGWSNEWPTFSPDGRWIAYTTCGPHSDACNLKLMRWNGSGQRVLVSAPPWRAFDPVWSRDGTRIGFSLCTLDRCTAWVLNLRTHERRRIRGLSVEAFAPDGSGLVVFDTVKGRPECGEGLFLTDLDGRNRVLLPGDCLAWADWQALP